MKVEKLRTGDSIGVFAPSSPLDKKNTQDLEASENLLSNYGLKILYGKNIYSNSLKYSATVDEKMQDFNQLISDKNIKSIIFARGGHNCNSLLDKIDYEQIKQNPKAFMGFSDNTVLLNAIYKKTGLITYHFTNFKGFCESNKEFNTRQFENCFLTGYSGKVVQSTKWLTIKKGIASGKLVGGNLNSIVKLLNTKYCPSFKNKILFIEAFGKETNAEQISSHFYQLKQRGVFEKISGLLLGNYESSESFTLDGILTDILKKYNFPTVKCDDFGHTATNIVLPIGIKCTLNADKCELIFNENTIRRTK